MRHTALLKERHMTRYHDIMTSHVNDESSWVKKKRLFITSFIFSVLVLDNRCEKNEEKLTKK